MVVHRSTSEIISLPTAEPPIGGTLKRVADFTIALASLILTLPALLIIFALIKITSRGSAIYAHTRIGFNGRIFHCYKFRTMVVDSDAVLTEYLASNVTAAKEWRCYRKLRRDPRVTPLGRFLRKTSLDELPQLYNVLQGDMSCVGPRPIPIDELPEYGEHVREYLKARPGLTGVWQVSGRNKLDYPRRVALDCQYVRNWSFWSDLAILAKTPFIVFNFDETS